MSRLKIHTERHLVSRIGWLRAAVLGANDGIISTASLMVGVASAAATPHNILIVGVSGLVAGAMSMAAGEYVSVGSQYDTEQSDLARERQELAEDPEAELQELIQIYINRGLTPSLAREVSIQFMQKDALGTHARDELGLSDMNTANPLVAAFTSALMFSVGAFFPLLIAILSPEEYLITFISISSLALLGVLGAASAKVGGAPIMKAMIRVMFWGALAFAITAGIGTIFDTNI